MNKAGRHWTVVVKRLPDRALRKLPHDGRKRVDGVLLALADEPRPHGCTKIEGHETLWRVKVGKWRITYSIEDDRRLVVVVEISTRGGAYRNL